MRKSFLLSLFLSHCEKIVRNFSEILQRSLKESGRLKSLISDKLCLSEEGIFILCKENV